MDVRCDRCQGLTRPKSIVSKKTGNTYTVYECLGGCKNGAYAYTCFAPREKSAPPVQTAQPSKADAVLASVQALDAKLERIIALLVAHPNRKVPAEIPDEF